MDMNARRTLLATAARPGSSRLDYVVSLDGEMETAAAGAPLAIGLRYVPDKWVLDAASFARYLAALAEGDPGAVEAIAVTIIEDVNNEAVPRWIQVAASTGKSDKRAGRISVLIEDRQPKWDNAALLSRLRTF